MVLVNLPTGQQWRGRHREQTFGHSGRERRWDDLRDAQGNIYIAICKIDSPGNLLSDTGNPHLALCDNLDGWDGEGGGRGVQEGVDMCIPVIDSC